jgi:hypothetical protein
MENVWYTVYISFVEKYQTFERRQSKEGNGVLKKKYKNES